MPTDHSADAILTAAHLTGMMFAQDPQVSPDGRWVAFTVLAASRPKKQKQPRAAIWLAPVDSSEPARRWTSADAREHTPRWSPDGRWLAFLSDRAEESKVQLYRIPVAGGEAERLTEWKAGVEWYAWSPDSTRIAFSAAEEEWFEDLKSRDESGDDALVWDDRVRFQRLRVLSLADKTITTHGPADRNVVDIAWAPSGREVAVALTIRPDFEAPSEAGVDIVRVPLDGSPVRPVTHAPHSEAALTWTADGKALLFTNWESESIPSSRAIFIVPAGGGERRCLTRGIDGCVLALLRPAGAATIFCTIAEGLTTRVYTLDPKTGRRSPCPMPPGVTATGELGVDASGRVLAMVCSTGAAPWDVWTGNPAGAYRKVSDCNPALAGIRWAAQEPFTWTAPDGLTLDGLLLHPAAARGTPPGVVLVHGGPYGRFLDGFNGTPTNWAQWLALDGYAVFLPNPRGGMGHGRAFAATVAGQVGMGDWQDIVSGTDAWVEAGHAQQARLGIGGWSQGGFMTAWAVSGGIPENLPKRSWNDDYTVFRPVPGDRFRAGVDGAGPTDWGAMVSESDLPTFEAMLGGSRPGDGIGPLRHHITSPLSYATRVHTPLLVLHGQIDQRVPLGQATGFFHELRRRHVPVQMAVYPREYHGIQEDAHQADILHRVRAWYARWLRGIKPKTH